MMDMNTEFDFIVDEILAKDSRYGDEAYYFLMEALAFTKKKLKRKRHVNGEELLEGVKDYLMDRYGPLAINVLKHWGITSTDDIGNIVTNLVQNKVLNQSDEDDIKSFVGAYNFDDVFRQGYRKRLHKKVKRMRVM